MCTSCNAQQQASTSSFTPSHGCATERETCSAKLRCTHRAGLERRSRNDAHAITAPPPLLAASAARMSLRSRPTESFVSGNPRAPPATPTQRHAGPDGPREPSRLRSGPAAAGGLPGTAGDVDGRDLRDGRGGGVFMGTRETIPASAHRRAVHKSRQGPRPTAPLGDGVHRLGMTFCRDSTKGGPGGPAGGGGGVWGTSSGRRTR